MKDFRRTAFVVLAVIASLLVILALVSTLYNNTSTWWIKATNFPRLQLLILSFICMALLPLTIRRWKVFNIIVASGLLLSVAIHGWFIWPYTPLAAKEIESHSGKTVDSKSKIGLFIANVYMKNDNAGALLNLIREVDPDLVLLLETNKRWQKQVQPLQQVYPYKVEYPLDNTYGLLLYSRYRLVDAEILFLEKPDVPSVHTKVDLPNGRQFMFHGMHPVPPVPSEAHPDNVNQKAGELDHLAKLIKRESLPSIVAGDLNDVAWSETSKLFRENSALKDVRNGRGFYSSFDANSFLFRWPLDHVYAHPEFKLLSLKRLGRFGSDHFPIFAELILSPR